MSGQGEAPVLTKAQMVRRRCARAGLGVLALGTALAVAACGASATAAPGERQTPSGMPVPRYVSLKFDKVNARTGPGDDQRLLFVYRVKGLPLQVVAETSEWRRVCDPDGTLAWVHKRTTDGRRTTMNISNQAVPMLKRPKDGYKIAAYLSPRALASVDRCDKGWCKIKADHASGWVRAGALWGTTDALQCAPSRGAGS